MDNFDVPFSVVAGTGCATMVLASVLAFIMMKSNSSSSGSKAEPAKEEPTAQGVDKEKYPGGQISVYYGTQTGTAESFAREIEREGEEHGFLVHVLDLEDVELEQLLTEERRDAESQVSRAFFLTSTYGEGEPTDNTVDFVAGLKAVTNVEVLLETSPEETKEPEGAAPESNNLAGLEYGVFGLGNREYEHYNAIGKFFDTALERAGGTRVVELGLGDDCQDLEGDFEAWKEKFWQALTARYIQDASALGARPAKTDELPACSYGVEYHDKNAPKTEIPLDKVHGSSKHYFTAFDCPVRVNRELRSKEDPGSTVHMEIDISKAEGLEYTTADNFGVLPINQSSVVESVAKSLGYDLDAVFSLKAAEGHEWHGAPFPMPISVRECLSRHCDITSAPRRSDLKLLASYAKDPVDKKALLRMASKEGKAEYREKIMDAHFGIVDVLKMCPSIEAPLEHFLNFCPLLQTRFYTISSSSSVHPQSVHLTVSVTDAARKDGSVFKGVCSNHLAGLQSGDMVRVFNRPSTFRLPKDSSKPILMVGPGTGIAPMRGLLQERQYQKTELQQTVGDNVLYFGCRKQTLDYLYESELKEFQTNGILTHLHLAFSREGSEKVYVQHLLAKNAQETWDLIHKSGASIYVCGGVKMGNDVHDALKTIATYQGKMSADEAKEYFNKLSQEGRFVQELWT